MLPVEIYCRNENVILRARNSEILILPTYTRVLRTLTEPKAFSDYFLQEALINRPARKLFEAWLRKDNTLWPRLFQNIQEHVSLPDANAPQAATEIVVAADSESATGEEKKKKTVAAGGAKKAPAVKKAQPPISKMASKTTANSSTKKTGRKKV